MSNECSGNVVANGENGNSVLLVTFRRTDPTLIKCKRFYPPGWVRAREARLRYYASVFPLVEVDSSYYGMPNAANSVLWAERTPPGFVFNIKAFRLFTGHQTASHTVSAGYSFNLHAELARLLRTGRRICRTSCSRNEKKPVLKPLSWFAAGKPGAVFAHR